MKVKTPLIASIGALLLVGALFLSLLLSTAAYRPGENEIVLPSKTPEAPTSEQIPGRNLEIVREVEVTPDNVQQVIESLSRAQSYTASVTSRLHYGAITGAMSCRQTVKNNACRVDHLNDSGAVQYTELLWNGAYYTWRAGADSYHKGVQGSFTADQTAMLPTYETVLDLPPEQITGAALTQNAGGWCITVDTQQEGRTASYRIAVQTGLLCAASFAEEGRVIRTVEVTISDEEPEDALFVLPGETATVYGAE